MKIKKRDSIDFEPVRFNDFDLFLFDIFLITENSKDQ